MSKTKVESITLNGSAQYMGGRIYYCNFSPNFSEKPSEVQINVINEKGSYQKPSINFQTPVKVKIGNLDLGDMYPYKYKNRYSSQGNVLEVYFIDPSFLLDKIFIGLNGKHGWTKEIAKDMDTMSKKTFSEFLGIPSSSSSSSSSGSPNTSTEVYEKKTDNFWIIGRQFHPCDENKDNYVSFDEAFNVDPCDPCPSCPEDKYENRCKELSYTTIFEVGYSFKDLIEAFQKFAPKQGSTQIDIEVPQGLSGDQDKYEKFYRDYFGPLREVLTSWANDFGLNWFYDIKDKKIKFIDISTREIEVPVNEIINTYKTDKLISYEHEVTAENTTQRGAISWYERGGERKSFDCSKASTVVLSALYGADYLGNRERTTLNGKDINSNTDVVGSILRAYNPLLRDLFWLRTIYDMKTSNDMIQYISDFSVTANSSSSSSIGDNEEYVLANNKVIAEYGDMQILAVIDCNLSTSDREKTTFQKIANFAYNDLILQMNELDAIKLVNNSGFFVVAYIDELALEKRYEMEDELYDFLGRFYARENLFRLCGLTGNEEFVKNNTNIESADGSAQIYSKKDGIGSHPLSKYKFYKSGYLGCIVDSGNLSTFDPQTPNRDSPNPSSTQGFNISTSNINNQDVVHLTDTPQAYNQAQGGAGSMFSLKKSNEIIPRFEQTAVILDREPKWVPEVQYFQETYNQKISDALGELEWKLFGGNGAPPNSTWLASAYGGNTGFLKSGTAGKIKVFIVNTGEFKVSPAEAGDFDQTTNHPTDKTANQTKKMLRRIGGKYSPQTAIGLLSNKCHEIKIGESGGGSSLTFPSIYTPPHTLVPKNSSNLIKKDVLSETKNQGDKATSCDVALGQEEFRVPAYRVYVSQSFNQSVTLPKIQTGVNSDMACSPNVRSFDVSYSKLTNDDFKTFTGSQGYGCIPNLNYLTGIHTAYTGNVFSNTTPDDTLNLEIKGLPDISDYQSEILRGLENISIQISDQGINSNLQYGTKMVKGISPDLLKFQNSRRFDRSVKGV
jgi:hypothetical protein